MRDYDEVIKTHATKWIPEWDWLWLKAQILATDKNTIFGFTKEMWQDIVQRMLYPPNAEATDPEFAIEGGIYFMAILRNSWSGPRSEDDRMRLAQLSFLAGVDNVMKARHLASVGDYEGVVNRLADVIGEDRASSALKEVMRIESVYTMLKKDGAGIVAIASISTLN